jgi:perosamine synthetase
MKQGARIPAFPVVRLWPRHRGGAWLQKFSSLHESGRAALYWALRSLALPRGTTAWMPSYHCGVEVDAAIEAGFEVRFYNVGANLSIDEEDLRRRIASHPGPILAIHYFGFPQPGIDRLANLSRQCGCTLIEDCAHALFSQDHAGRELGSFSPLAIYSLRKTLPVLDGGAVCAMGNVLSPPELSRFSIDAYRLYFKMAVQTMVGDSLTSLYRTLRWRNDTASHSEEQGAARPQPVAYREPMSLISRVLAAGTGPAEVVKARRDNFTALHYLLTGLHGYRPVWEALPVGTCPLFLPVWVENRTEIMAQLAAHGIETFRFGASSPHKLDPNEFPEAAMLRERILCLPVHQGLGSSDIEYMGKTFREAVRNVPRPHMAPVH